MRDDEDVLQQHIRDEQRLISRDYYGDVVRNLLVTADIILLVTLPFLVSQSPIPFIVSIVGIVLTGLAAGFTSPRFKWALIADAIISALALILLEYAAIVEYQAATTSKVFLFFNQIVSLLFFLALYYSIQTLRRWVK